MRLSEIQYSFIGHENTDETNRFIIDLTQGKLLFKDKLTMKKTLQLNCVFRQEIKAVHLKVHTVKF